MSEHPDSAGSVGWDASLPRIATWVKLMDKKKGLSLYVINTHLDHIGREARLQSAELIKRWISDNALPLPVILTGDLNVTEDSEIYKSLTDEYSPLADSYKICKKKDGVIYSFHNFGRIKDSNRPKIDYIFVPKGGKVKSFSIPREDSIDGVFMSDHNPIIAHIII